jgi:hypothetical protein
VAKRAGKGDLFSSYEWFEFFVGYQVKLFHEKIKVLVARVHVGLCADLCHLREVVVVYVHKYLMPAEGWRAGPTRRIPGVSTGSPRQRARQSCTISGSAWV